jgi:uncharacterized protein YqeY
MSEKRKVGRPRKTSAPVVEKINVVTWKQKYHDLLKEYKLREETSEMFIANAREVLSEQADNQLEIIKLVLDSYSSIEGQCKTALDLTGSIEEADVMYLTSFARRVLLHKFSDFNKASEE